MWYSIIFQSSFVYPFEVWYIFLPWLSHENLQQEIYVILNGVYLLVTLMWFGYIAFLLYVLWSINIIELKIS